MQLRVQGQTRPVRKSTSTSHMGKQKSYGQSHCIKIWKALFLSVEICIRKKTWIANTVWVLFFFETQILISIISAGLWKSFQKVIDLTTPIPWQWPGATCVCFVSSSEGSWAQAESAGRARETGCLLIPASHNFAWIKPAILHLLVQETVINHPGVTLCFNTPVSSLTLQWASLGLLDAEALFTDAQGAQCHFLSYGGHFHSSKKIYLSIPPPKHLCLPENKRETPSQASAALWDNRAVNALVTSSTREFTPQHFVTRWSSSPRAMVFTSAAPL